MGDRRYPNRTGNQYGPSPVRATPQSTTNLRNLQTSQGAQRTVKVSSYSTGPGAQKPPSPGVSRSRHPNQEVPGRPPAPRSHAGSNNSSHHVTQRRPSPSASSAFNHDEDAPERPPLPSRPRVGSNSPRHVTQSPPNSNAHNRNEVAPRRPSRTTRSHVDSDNSPTHRPPSPSLVNGRYHHEDLDEPGRHPLTGSHTVSNNSPTPKEWSCLMNQLETQKQNNEKLRRDMELLLAEANKYKAGYQKVFTELESVKDEMRVKDLKMREMKPYIEEMSKLHDELNEKDLEISKLKGSLEEVEALRAQAEVYKSDFQDERDAREKQQGKIIELEERNEHLTIENNKFREVIEQRDNHNFAKAEQHGYLRDKIPKMLRSKPKPEEYKNDFHAERDARGKKQKHVGQNEQNQQFILENNRNRKDIEQRGNQDYRIPQGQGFRSMGHHRDMNGNSNARPDLKSLQWETPGKESGHHYPMQQAQQNRQGEAKQRKCPKCHKVCRDLDTLQIHVMECLDT